MPTVNLSRKEFDKLVGKKLSLDKLKDRISMLGTDLEEITESEIIVEVFPNRPDMLSEQGFARAFSSFIGVKPGLRKYNIKKSTDRVIIDNFVRDVRPYTVCAIVKNINFDEEKIKQVIQIQEKLHVSIGRNRKKIAIGIYPFEKIRTPIYYKALEPNKIKFKPLEFDKELTALQILSKHPAGREYGYLLDGKKKFPVFMDSNNKVLSMPPVINSEDTGKITKKTKDVFIECSGFNLDAQEKCLNIIVTALIDMGGEAYSMELQYGDKTITTPDFEPKKMKLDLDYANKVLGLKLKESDIKKYLEMMGFDYRKKTIFIPPYRADILHPIDLIEDIAIAYGYENFKEEIPNVSTIGSEDPFYKFKDKIADILTGFGLIEVNNYNLTNKKIQSDKMNFKTENIEVKNTVNAEYNALRSWIIPSLLDTLENNKHYDYPQNIFEIGYCFSEKEESKLCVMLCGNKVDFTSVKQILDYLINDLGFKYSADEIKHPSFIEGRVGSVSINKKTVGVIGEIHPEVLGNFRLEMPVSCFEINLNEIFSLFYKQ